MSDDLKENVQNVTVWKRLMYMLLFSVFNWVAKVVLIAVIVFQFLLSLFTGKNDGPAKRLGSQLSAYIYQVLRFLTYNTETHPFPFSDWPSGNELVITEKPKRKTAAPRRKPVKKKVAVVESTEDKGETPKE